MDLVVATGVSHSLKDFMNLAFEAVGLQNKDQIIRDPYLLRRINENLFVVLASWDLTELERAVMEGYVE